MSYKNHGLLTLREHLGSHPVSDGNRVAHNFSFLCCVCGGGAGWGGCFICLRSVSCVLNVASVYELSILDYPFQFSLTFS